MILKIFIVKKPNTEGYSYLTDSLLKAEGFKRKYKDKGLQLLSFEFEVEETKVDV